MAKSHLNQAIDALAAVGCVLHMIGWKKDRPNITKCPVCGQATGWLGREKDARLPTRMVCMGKRCQAKRRAFKIRSERGQGLVLDA
jgi:hypothetical protein